MKLRVDVEQERYDELVRSEANLRVVFEFLNNRIKFDKNYDENADGIAIEVNSKELADLYAVLFPAKYAALTMRKNASEKR